MLKNVSGFEPGDTIAVRPDKSGIVAKDWADVAKGMLPEKVEHLEGTERGLTALMKEANDRFAQGRNSTQQASNQPLQLGCAAGDEAGAETFRGIPIDKRSQQGLRSAQPLVRPVQSAKAPRAFLQFSEGAQVSCLMVRREP